MLDSIQSLLDAFPDGVIQVRAGLVLAANAKAQQYIPRLTPGSPLPDCVPLPEQEGAVTGVFTAGNSTYIYSSAPDPDGTGHVILFRPDPQAGLKGWQLDGALRQLRELMGELLAEVGPATEGGQLPAAAFSKTFHRLFRLIGNLEFMRQAAAEGGVPFRPVTMDLDGLCGQTAQLAGDLLREAGVSLEYRYRSQVSGLLIPGDPRLLRKLLLSLISNAARAAGEGGKVVLTLRRQGENAVVAVSNSGAAPSRRQLSDFFREGAGEDIPLPGQGAGLGIPIARHILSLHGGSMVALPGDEPAFRVVISLPTGPLGRRLELRAPFAAQTDGGLDPVLVELSDVLPARLFGMEGLD